MWNIWLKKPNLTQFWVDAIPAQNYNSSFTFLWRVCWTLLVGRGWAHLEKHGWMHCQPGSSCCSPQAGGWPPLSPQSPSCLASCSSSRNWAATPTHRRRNTVTQTEFTKGERGPLLVGQKSTRPPIRRNVTFQNSRVGSGLCYTSTHSRWLRSRATMLQGGAHVSQP